MKKILASTDCTIASKAAIDYAARLARDFGAELQLLHVYYDTAATMETAATVATATLSLRRELEVALEKERTRLQQEFGIGAQVNLLAGIKTAAIYDTAKNWHPDLVVMGRNGGKDASLWNSTTLQSIEKTRTPLLVVPEGVNFGPLKYTVLCTDYQLLNDVACLQVYLELIEQYNASVLLLHFQKPGTKANEAGREQVTKVFQSVTHWNMELTDDFTHGMHQFLQEHSADLLVMIAHRHSMLERLFGTIHTRTEARKKLDRPLLILPDK